MWKEYTTAVLGLGVIVVALMGLTETTLIWTLVVLGAGILIFGVWSAGLLSSSSDYMNRKSHA